MDFLSERQKKVLRKRVLTGNVIYHINKLGGACVTLENLIYFYRTLV
jgi:hypothetical protein